MKFILFAVKDAFDRSISIAGVTDTLLLIDPIPLDGESEQAVAKSFAASIRAEHKGAQISFTDQPESHPIVQEALKDVPDKKESPVRRSDGFLCPSCTHARVCTVSNAIILLRTIDIRVTSCESHIEAEAEEGEK